MLLLRKSCLSLHAIYSLTGRDHSEEEGSEGEGEGGEDEEDEDEDEEEEGDDDDDDEEEDEDEGDGEEEEGEGEGEGDGEEDVDMAEGDEGTSLASFSLYSLVPHRQGFPKLMLSIITYVPSLSTQTPPAPPSPPAALHPLFHHPAQNPLHRSYSRYTPSYSRALPSSHSRLVLSPHRSSGRVCTGIQSVVERQWQSGDDCPAARYGRSGRGRE